jgi:gas vesicle protein
MGRFLLGFAIGAAIGAAAVVITAPRSGSETREGIRGLLSDTLDVARRASAAREQELWTDFRARLARKDTESHSRF